MSTTATGYLTRRISHLVPVWLGASLLAFGIASLAPGDPAEMILLQRSGQNPSAEAVRRLRGQLGLDRPFLVRYARWMASAARGDLGRSYRTGEPVLRGLGERFPATVQLASSGMLIAVLIALPLGVASAARRDSSIDHGSRLLALLGASLPSFWLGYLLILLFGVWLGLLPVAGRGGVRHLVLPALTLGAGVMAGLMRLTRSAVLDVLQEAYLRTARAKGLAERRVLVRHALRNALNPIVTLVGLRLGYLLAGTVIVESVFGWPGVGSYLIDSIRARDYPTVQGFILCAGTMFVILNLLVDLSYLWLDPRVRFTSPEQRRSHRSR